MFERHQNCLQCFVESFFWLVKVRQLNGEVKRKDEFVSARSDGVSKVYEVSVHHQSLLGCRIFKGGEALENLGDLNVVDFVDLN